MDRTPDRRCFPVIPQPDYFPKIRFFLRLYLVSVFNIGIIQSSEVTRQRNTRGDGIMTNFQKTHRPIRCIENKCNGSLMSSKGGRCCKCGRYLERKVPHNPNVTGSLGYTL